MPRARPCTLPFTIYQDKYCSIEYTEYLPHLLDGHGGDGDRGGARPGGGGLLAREERGCGRAGPGHAREGAGALGLSLARLGADHGREEVLHAAAGLLLALLAAGGGLLRVLLTQQPQQVAARVHVLLRRLLAYLRGLEELLQVALAGHRLLLPNRLLVRHLLHQLLDPLPDLLALRLKQYERLIYEYDTLTNNSLPFRRTKSQISHLRGSCTVGKGTVAGSRGPS